MKQIKGSEELQKNVVKGVDKLSDAVASTLGPCGRNVLLKDKSKKPYITKDGVSVAKHISLEDPFENAAATILRQAAEQTATNAGDGTTTSTVLARAMIHGSLSVINQGASPIEVQRGMNKAALRIAEKFKENSKQLSSLEEIKNIATISANGDRGLGELIASAVDVVGKNGSIAIKEAHSTQTKLDLHEGFRFDGGFTVNQFLTEERTGLVRYENALVLVTDLEFTLAEQVQVVAEIATREGKPLIIISEKMEGQALAALIYHHMKGNLKACFIKAPRYGEERRNILEDLSIAIGAKFISRLNGHSLKDLNLTSMATVATIESSKYSTTIVARDDANTGDNVDKRISMLQSQLAETPLGREAEQLQERITRLSSAVAVISVGAPTEVEMREKKDRIEDALEAVKSAQEEGILPGGGLSLWKFGYGLTASDDLEDKLENEQQLAGALIVKHACQEPLKQMLKNAGMDVEHWMEKLRKESTSQSVGIDIYRKEVCDILERGIIDPCKVTRCALENAVSAAGTLITTSFASIEID